MYINRIIEISLCTAMARPTSQAAADQSESTIYQPVLSTAQNYHPSSIYYNFNIPSQKSKVFTSPLQSTRNSSIHSLFTVFDKARNLRQGRCHSSVYLAYCVSSFLSLSTIGLSPVYIAAPCVRRYRLDWPIPLSPREILSLYFTSDLPVYTQQLFPEYTAICHLVFGLLFSRDTLSYVV